MLLRAELLAALALPIGIGLIAQGRFADAPARATVIDAETHADVSFSEQIAPIFEARCSECHSADNAELGLNLSTYEGAIAGSDYGAVIEPGNPDGSLILDMIASGDMPEEGDPVPPEELELLRTWIAEGAQNN